MRGTLRVVVAAAVLGVTALITACSGGNDSLAAQWKDGLDKGYIGGDGSTSDIAPEARTAPVEFSGETDEGGRVSSDDTIGQVTLVNFWYANCAPCRAEAGDLVAAYEEFAPEGVAFLGVNTRDGAAVSRGFAEEFGITYPSILDTAEDRAVQRAFAGQIPLNAVPTTLILDTEGRVAHRILGQIADVSQLRALLNETLAEG